MSETPGTEILISKTLSRLLRHNNGDTPLDFDGQGYADFDAVARQVVSTPKLKSAHVGVDDILSVIETDGKGRFEVSGDRVRALSGHSFPVDIGGEPFTPEGPLYFGTVTAKRERILAQGLAHSAKLLVRLSTTYEEAMAIAELRQGDPFIVEVDAVSLAVSGATFSLLPNGEVVTDKFGPEYVGEAVPPRANAARPAPSL